MAVAKKEAEQTVFAFEKERILESERYVYQKDLVNALLVDGKEYTFEEVDTLINEFLERKVGQ